MISKLRASLLALCLMVTPLRLMSAEGIINLEVRTGEDAKKVVMSKAELVAILMSQKVFWSNGTKVTVYLLPRDSRAAREFLFSLGIPPSAYFDSVNNMYSSGKANVPIILQTDVSVLLNVSNTRGAVGYISDGNLVTLVPSVRTIELEDKR